MRFAHYSVTVCVPTTKNETLLKCAFWQIHLNGRTIQRIQTTFYYEFGEYIIPITLPEKERLCAGLTTVEMLKGKTSTGDKNTNITHLNGRSKENGFLIGCCRFLYAYFWLVIGQQWWRCVCMWRYYEGNQHYFFFFVFFRWASAVFRSAQSEFFGVETIANVRGFN